MIITCASCLTKYRLDDSRISPKGSKVRCSRCQHVFYVVPPPETKEEVVEDFESFAKYHEELIGPEQKGKEVSPPEEEEKKEEEKKEKRETEVIEEEEEKFLFSEKPPLEKREEVTPQEISEEKEAEARRIEPVEVIEEGRKVRRERKSSLRFFGLIVIIVLLVFGLFTLWTEMESGGKLSPYLEYPVKKITDFWNQIWGTEREGLVVRDLNGYEEKIGEVSLFIIEGKVDNQSRQDRRHIRVKVVIFDQEKSRVAEKETLCGRLLPRGEWKALPPEFFQGEMIIKPKTPEEMISPSGKSIPFMVVFKDLPPQAKEFKVEITEAPSL